MNIVFHYDRGRGKDIRFLAFKAKHGIKGVTHSREDQNAPPITVLTSNYGVHIKDLARNLGCSVNDMVEAMIDVPYWEYQENSDLMLFEDDDVLDMAILYLFENTEKKHKLKHRQKSLFCIWETALSALKELLRR